MSRSLLGKLQLGGSFEVLALWPPCGPPERHRAYRLSLRMAGCDQSRGDRELQDAGFVDTGRRGDGDVLAGWRVACVGQALKKLLVDVPEGLPGVVAEGDKEIDVGDVGAAPVGGGAFGEGSTQPCPGSGSGLEIVIPGIIEQAGRCRSERCPYCFGGRSSWLNLRECLRGWSGMHLKLGGHFGERQCRLNQSGRAHGDASATDSGKVSGEARGVQGCGRRETRPAPKLIRGR